MYNKAIFILFFTALLTTMFISCSEVNNPGVDLFQQQDSYEVIGSDLSLLKKGGMDLERADGIFSIGWNEIFTTLRYRFRIDGKCFCGSIW